MADVEFMETDISIQEKNVLESYLLLALPQLSKNPTTLAKLLERVISLGVEKPSDLNLIRQEDIDQSILKPIQIRLLQQYVERNSEVTSKRDSTSDLIDKQVGESSREVPQNTQNRVCKSNWVEKYKIDPEIFKQSVKTQLLSGKKLSKKARRTAVKDLVNNILQVCPRPLTSQLMEVAKKLYSIYPEAICDKLDGEILGCGYASFGTQLKNRIENMTRDKDNNIPRVRKSQKNKYVSRIDHFNSQPENELVGKEACLVAQQELKAMAHELTPNIETVKKNLKDTYILQRDDCNEELHGKTLHENWPFLFETYGIFVHNEILLGKDLRALFHTFFTENGKKILGLFSRIKSKEIKEIMKKYDKNSSWNSLNSISCIIHLLFKHFNEKSENIFPCFEPGTSLEELEKKIKAHPCLTVSGTDLFTAEMLMLSIDNNIVNDHIQASDLIDALAALLGIYYMTNIKYPDECACFMEFFQRCAAKINPQAKKGRKKPPPVNPKVLALINKLQNFEWSSESDMNIIEEEAD